MVPVRHIESKMALLGCGGRASETSQWFRAARHAFNPRPFEQPENIGMAHHDRYCAGTECRLL
jgi:hypothetical protein